VCSRCTGYRPIVSSFTRFAGAYADDVLNGLVEVPDALPHGSETTVCPSTGKPCSCSGNGKSANTALCESGNVSSPGLLRSDLIFPPELKAGS